MTPELQSRIANAITEAHQKGVKANLVVLGREEEHLLEGDDPAQLNFRLCHFLIDNCSKSRCDAYGQASLNYIQPKTRPQLSKKEIMTTAVGERFADFDFQEDAIAAGLDKKSILASGFESNHFKSRYQGWVEDYQYIKNKNIHLQHLKDGNFKLYDSRTEYTLFVGIISAIPHLKQLIQKHC